LADPGETSLERFNDGFDFITRKTCRKPGSRSKAIREVPELME